MQLTFNKTSAILAGIFMMAILAAGLNGCDRFSKKPAPPAPNSPAVRKNTVPQRKPGVPRPGNVAAGNKKTAKAKKEKEEPPDLIKQAGFDMIYPNFNRKTGRRDPFVPVSIMEGDWDTLKRIAGEKFRVIGTAMTPSGQIAMIEIGEQTKIVREGDVLENGSIVKRITKYNVTLEKNEREMLLEMLTKKRVARSFEYEEPQLKIKMPDNINDQWWKYLDGKYKEDYAGQEGESSRPDSFTDFLSGGDKKRSRKSDGPKRMF